MPVVTVAAREASLKRRIRAHLHRLGFTRDENGDLQTPRLDKEAYRQIHMPQRRERLAAESRFLTAKSENLLNYFANGSEVDLDRFKVRLELIEQQTWQSDLFRFATLLWSIPVSYGFGRRMRYLIWDETTNKLVGLFALGDPVFNLGARDQLVGWSSSERVQRLVYMLDGYVVGAVPPYSNLLGSKLIACLMRSREVIDDFRERYGSSEGLISGVEKNAHLVAVTTTSALGRSSVYNRLKLGGVSYLEPIGFTGGYGHFHFPNDLFVDMRSYLKARKHPYANNHQFGDGPNWRLRAIRHTLRLLDMNPDLLRHGFAREVYFGRLADNALEILSGRRKRPVYQSLRPAAEIASMAVERWMRPRMTRDGTYLEINRSSIERAIECGPNVTPRQRERARA